MIIITGSIPTSPEVHEEIVALCVKHSIRSRGEPGCISHNVHVDLEDPARLFFYERWEDAAAVAVHFGVPESLELVERLTTLVGERPEMRIYRAETVELQDLT